MPTRPACPHDAAPTVLPAWPARLTSVLVGSVMLGACATSGPPPASAGTAPRSAAPPVAQVAPDAAAKAAKEDSGPTEESAAASRAFPRAGNVGGRGLSPYAAFLAGHHAMVIKDYGKAATYLSHALTYAPDSSLLNRRVLMLRAAIGDIGGADAVAGRILAEGGEETLPLLVRMVAAIDKGDWSAADGLIDRLGDQGLDALLKATLGAWSHMRKDARAPDTALAVLAPLKEVEQFATLYWFHAGLILDVAGRPDAAAEAFATMLATPDGRTLRAVDAAASLALRRGRPDEAEKIYALYGEQRPDSLLLDRYRTRQVEAEGQAMPVTGARAGMAEVLFTAATSLRANNNFDTALVLARLALELDGGLHLARVLVGDVLRGVGRDDDAIATYRQVPARSPAYYAATLRRAESLGLTERLDEARRLLDALSEGYPDRPEALVALGDLMRGAERWEESWRAYDEAVARIGEIKPHHWDLLFNRAIALERDKRWNRAEKDLLKALAFEPNQPYVLNYLGYSWLEQGKNVDQAIGMIEKAVDQRPRDGYITDSLGWGHYLTGNYLKAAEVLERAVELQPDDVTITDHFGDALWRVGRRLEARYQWERALTLDPEPDKVDAIKAKIENGLPPLDR